MLCYPKLRHGFFIYCSLKLFPQVLSDRYEQLRRVRGDGNCFVRAYAFAVFEKLIRAGSFAIDLARVDSLLDEEEIHLFLQYLKDSKEKLLKEGFSEFIEDFQVPLRVSAIFKCSCVLTNLVCKGGRGCLQNAWVCLRRSF